MWSVKDECIHIILLIIESASKHFEPELLVLQPKIEKAPQTATEKRMKRRLFALYG
jgi:hypothetical protein